MADEIAIPFQWNISLYMPVVQNDCEYSSDLEFNELNDHDGYDSEEDPNISPESESPIENFCDLGEMLIINSGDAQEPFWIGRSTENVPKSAKDLEVHWYELTARGKDPLRHAYVPMDIPQKIKSRYKRTKRYVSIIDIDTIIMRFSKLDKHNRIPAAIIGEYMRMAKSNNLRYSMKP